MDFTRSRLIWLDAKAFSTVEGDFGLLMLTEPDFHGVVEVIRQDTRHHVGANTLGPRHKERA